MIETVKTVILTCFWIAFVISIEKWLRKKQEAHLLWLCGVVPAALLVVGVPSPIAVAVAILLALGPLVTAWRRDRAYGQKLLKYSVPVIAFYVLLALFSLYSHHWKFW